MQYLHGDEQQGRTAYLQPFNVYEVLPSLVCYFSQFTGFYYNLRFQSSALHYPMTTMEDLLLIYEMGTKKPDISYSFLNRRTGNKLKTNYLRSTGCNFVPKACSLFVIAYKCLRHVVEKVSISSCTH